VIGAAHSGWKGAIGGVLENTIAAMESLGASRGSIIAAIGPLIRQQSYEVGAEFVARFSEGARTMRVSSCRPTGQTTRCSISPVISACGWRMRAS
jgi:copper oxidase (laccase) domain-containing protein